jgi:hypothetical protein
MATNKSTLRSKQAMIKKVTEMSEKLVQQIKDNPEDRSACLLVMLLSVWRQAVHDNKIDATAMAAFGIQHLFSQAPRDNGRIQMELLESENGDFAIIVIPTEDPRPKLT